MNLENLEKLSEKEKDEIAKETIENLYDRRLCEVHKIDYVNPDFIKAMNETYKEYNEK